MVHLQEGVRLWKHAQLWPLPDPGRHDGQPLPGCGCRVPAGLLPLSLSPTVFSFSRPGQPGGGPLLHYQVRRSSSSPGLASCRGNSMPHKPHKPHKAGVICYSFCSLLIYIYTCTYLYSRGIDTCPFLFQPYSKVTLEFQSEVCWDQWFFRGGTLWHVSTHTREYWGNKLCACTITYVHVSVCVWYLFSSKYNYMYIFHAFYLLMCMHAATS